MTVAGVTSKTAARSLPKGRARILRLALSAKSRRAIRSALRSRRAIKARVVVLARDEWGNATRATRTVTLRR